MRKYYEDGDYIGIVLDAVPEAVEFYRKIGFEDASSIPNELYGTGLTYMIYYFIGIDEVKPKSVNHNLIY